MCRLLTEPSVDDSSALSPHAGRCERLAACIHGQPGTHSSSGLVWCISSHPRPAEQVAPAPALGGCAELVEHGWALLGWHLASQGTGLSRMQKVWTGRKYLQAVANSIVGRHAVFGGLKVAVSVELHRTHAGGLCAAPNLVPPITVAPVAVTAGPPCLAPCPSRPTSCLAPQTPARPPGRLSRHTAPRS